MRIKTYTIIFALIIALLLPLTVRLQEVAKPSQDRRAVALNAANNRAATAADIFQSIMASVKTRLPLYIIEAAQTIAIFSSRTSFSPGKDDGVGLVSARDPKTKKWRAPIFLTFKSGHIEDQYEDTKLKKLFDFKEGELILLGMNQRSAPYYLAEEFELGSDALVLAGSFGNVSNPGDDLTNISSGFLAYYHSKGAIVGVSVAGSVIRQDEELNDAVYEERRLASFLEPGKFISEPVLTFPSMLNKY